MGSGLFSAKGEGLKAFTLFEGVLMLVLGVLALIFPVLASAWIAVIVAVGCLVVFILEGVVSMLVALGHTRVSGWGWGLLNGIVTLILGVLIVTMQAWGLLWVIGVLVGISFLFSGIDLLAFSASFHGDD